VRLVSLGSGSRGNAAVVEAGGTRLLIDCGFSLRELELRLGQVGVDPQTLDAVLVTHEHQDHVKGVGAVARRYRLPVWMTAGTRRHARSGVLPREELFTTHGAELRIGDLVVRPFPVPHDARETAQFIFSNGRQRVALLTDLGHITPYILELLQGCDGLLLECNHDRDMLANGPYPPSLRRRVGGSLGHLSNDQSRDLLQRIDHCRLRFLVAGHLSEKNNATERVRATILDAIPGLESRLSFALQEEVTAWHELQG